MERTLVGLRENFRMEKLLNLQMVWKDLQKANDACYLGNVSMMAYALCAAIKDWNPDLYVAYQAEWNKAGSHYPDLTVCSNGELPQALFVGLVRSLIDDQDGVDRILAVLRKLSSQSQVMVPFNENGGHGIAARELPVAEDCEFGLLVAVTRPFARTAYSAIVMQLPLSLRARFHLACVIQAADSSSGSELLYFPPEPLG